MKTNFKSARGITLIALVITIIVLLILAGISISMLSGDNGILNKAVQAKDATRGGEVQETVTLEAANNAGAEYLGGTKKTRAQVISELHANGKLTDAEVATLEESNTITIGGITIDFSVLGSISGNLTLGDVYTDGMIGQELSYTANFSSGYTGKWIVFGKDTSGNILITTELPIDNAFTLKGGAESWLKYESDTDTTYGLNYACSGYGGTVQGTPVSSRSIKMEDINYVAGLTSKTVTADGNTYNIQSFDTYTFGTTQDYANKKVNYWYPVSSGGTLADGTGSGFWQKPTEGKEKTFQNNWYGYFCDWEDGKYKYWGADTDGNNVDASTVGLNTDKLKYIWGGNTEETCYNEYLVASRSVCVYSDAAFFRVAGVGISEVRAGSCDLCYSNSSLAYDDDAIGSYGVRPVVVLPSSLLVEDKGNETYDLAD